MGVRLLWLPGAGGGGWKRGGAPGAVVREEGEAALGRRDEEEEGRVAMWARRPNGSAGLWAEWAESEGKIFSE
jgi:hypothetical protein